ncbi:hypothetical protein DV737_g3372, partial [Chaetothyriales sp. CBS 132003]
MSVSHSTIAFIGATGGCANTCLIHALRDGNSCIALARTPDKLRRQLEEQGVPESLIASRLTIVQGNATQVEDIKKTLVDCSGKLVDTIVSGLGGSPILHFDWCHPLQIASLDNPAVCETAAATLINALTALYHDQPALKATKPALVFVSTTGISRGPEDVPFWIRFLYHQVLTIPHVDKRKMEDRFRGDNHVFRAVTAIRPTLLAGTVNVDDALGLDRVRAGTESRPALGYNIKRADVGHWMYANTIRPGHAKTRWEGQSWDSWDQGLGRIEASDGHWHWLLAAIAVSAFAASLAVFLFGRDSSFAIFHVEHPEQLKKSYTWCDSADGHVVDEIHDGKIFPRCPADGRLLQHDPIIPASAVDLDHAIAAAAAAQKSWSQTTLGQRKQVLRTLLRFVIAHQDKIATASSLDSGKTLIDASFGEVLVTVEKLQWTLRHGDAALAPSRRPTNLLMCYKSNTVYYEPLGVVAACVSWNYPFHNLISPVISAIFAGNAIVVKPSEQTAWSSLYFTRIIKAALQACGHSPDLLQTVICLPDVADHLTCHPTIKHITFIGSRPVAHKVAASAAKSLTALTVELGGKDPVIVLDDPTTVADISNVASILLRGVFQASGQNCIGLERVIALPGVHDKLLSLVLPTIKSLTVGNVLRDDDVAAAATTTTPDVGAMISSRTFAHLESLINSAVQAGAILHCGGSRYHHPKYPHGTYFAPTLVSNVTPDMEIAHTELFAPIFLLMRADTVDHAIRIANSTSSSTDFALGASVFGHHQADVDKCVHAIKAGNVAVNDFGAFYACSMPFGGRDGSGYGRFGGHEGLRALCNLKSVSRDACSTFSLSSW